MFDFPSPATTGQQVTTPNGGIFTWDGVKWAAGSMPTNVARVQVGDTAPASPSMGDLWFDSIGTQTYLRYNDGNSQQWVPTTNQTSYILEAPQDGGIYGRRNAAWANVATAPQVQNNVGRNLIHNPYFNIVQRSGQPWTVSNGYMADRWVQAFTGGTMSTTITTISDATRAQIGDESATSALTCAFAGGSGTTALTYIEQRTEGVRRTAGKTLIFSFWASGSAGLKLGLNLFQIFGSGGSPSAYVACTAQTITLLAGWVRYSATFSVPSAAGKVFGTNKDDSLFARFILSTGSGATDEGATGVQSGTINLWGVQLEIGSVATPLEKIDYQADLANCRRFFQQGLLAYNATCYTTVAGQYVTATINLSPALRGTPTFSNVTDYSSNLGTIGITLFSQNTIYVSAQATAAGICSMNHQFDASADL